jgi:mRNA interferase MazF
MPEQGDIVLVPVPFTDLSSQKRRPVIVKSNDAYHRTAADFVVVAMTSSTFSTAYSFQVRSNDLIEGAESAGDCASRQDLYACKIDCSKEVWEGFASCHRPHSAVDRYAYLASSLKSRV